ncbi:MAG: hypothetical protein O3A51_04920 [Verrucomicrobia bacterium]|nr:hypothetical protein [Verrucomicrobiota bacterium]
MIEAWMEWKERCAAARCTPATRRCLFAFARSRFRLFARRYARLTNNPDAARALTLSDEDIWHMFERDLQTDETRAGTRYKDWLFARTRRSQDAPFDVIQGGATLMMRDVVRSWLVQEHLPPDTVSLDQPVTTGESPPLTLADLLPSGTSPADEVALREYQVLAQQLAPDLANQLATTAKLAILAKDMGLSLSDPRIARAAGCQKSALHKAYHGAMQHMAQHVKGLFPGEPPDAVLTLTLVTLSEIKKSLYLKKSAEKRLRVFFRSVGTPNPV